MKKRKEEIEKNEVDPKSYFNYVKSRKKESTNEYLQNIYIQTLELLTKYKATGQTQGMKKLIFILESVEKELEIIERGFSIYIDKSDIQEYIETVEDRVVKIIEISRYEREIPDHVVEDMLKVKDLFDDFFVVYTDYSDNFLNKVNERTIEKDPILFGVFYDEEDNELLERFYFIGDWEDEYCDLTLGKMVAEMSRNQNKDIEKDLLTHGEIADLKKELDKRTKSTNNRLKDKSIFEKIKSFFTKVLGG